MPEFSAAYQLASGYDVTAAVSRGFRNPTIRELYLFPAPNPDLLPEHMWNYQLTLRAQPSRNLAASVTGHYADLDNLIVVTGRFPNLQLLNTGGALNRGLDATARWRLGRRIALNGGYAWLRSTNLAPYVPRQKGTYALEIDLDRVFIHLGGVTVGRRRASASDTSELGGYTVPTLKATVPMGRRWTVFAVVDNLFDEDYQVVTGYPMPGINAAGGFTCQF